MRALTQIASRAAESHLVIVPIVTLVMAILFMSRIVPPFEVISSSITRDAHKGGDIVVERHLRWFRWDCKSFVSNAAILDSLKPVPFTHAFQTIPFGDLYPQRRFRTPWPVGFSVPLGPATFTNKLKFSCFPFYDIWPLEVKLPDVQFHVGERIGG